MTHAAHNRTLLTLVVTLSSVLFVADLFMPLESRSACCTREWYWWLPVLRMLACPS